VVWVCNLKESAIQETFVLQPGKYRIEYRPRNSKESIYTVERIFKVESGSSTQVKLY
jgi:Ca-activated chloride channel family protein